MDRLTVVLADDHPSIRMAVKAALELDGCDVLASVSSGPEAVVAVQAHAPDVCLLDVKMPAGDGISAARELSRVAPATAVVMLSASDDADDLFAALRAGARGYLLKGMDPDRLGAALRGVLAGEAALPRSMVTRLVEQFAAEPERPAPKLQVTAGLTAREQEVLTLLSVGLSTEDIAARMFVGQVTVRTHVSNILKKLKVADREAAVRMALREERLA